MCVCLSLSPPPPLFSSVVSSPPFFFTYIHTCTHLRTYLHDDDEEALADIHSLFFFIGFCCRNVGVIILAFSFFFSLFFVFFHKNGLLDDGNQKTRVST